MLKLDGVLPSLWDGLLFPVDTIMYMQHKFVQALPCEQFILPHRLVVLTLTTEIDSRPFLQPGVLSDENL
jgi:hypothetical protein